MKHTHLPKALFITLLLCGVFLALQSVMFEGTFQANLISEGVDTVAGQVDLPTTNTDLRQTAGNTIRFVVTFLSLAAVITIIIAGVILILGAGSESSVTRARNIVIYTIIGIVIVFFARVIVLFFTQELASRF